MPIPKDPFILLNTILKLKHECHNGIEKHVFAQNINLIPPPQKKHWVV